MITQQYGDDYYKRPEDVVELGNRTRTIEQKVTDYFQQIVYSINQPAAARGYQSIFWNIAYFDKYYFESIFEGFYFPDGDQPKWNSVSWLQKKFMKWFNKERTKAVLTFPVETLNLLTDENGYRDKEWADFAAEMLAEGHSFFIYRSNSVDALASCCRLRNAVEENTFSYTLGAGAIQTGSKGVITMNLNRIVQDWYRETEDKTMTSLSNYLTEIVKRVHVYLSAFNDIIWDDYNAGLLTVFKAGFIDLDKQYLTLGINGFVEAAEFLKIKIDPNNEEYKLFSKTILKTISDLNKQAKTEHCKFNTEFVPAESLGAKNAHWDEQDGYEVPRPLYNSYFYKVEDENADPLKKFRYHGKDFTGYCDGGSALHCNLEEHLSQKHYRMLMDVAVQEDTPYFTFNVPNTVCNDCGFISKHNLKKCPHCGSENLDYLTRVIGYLKRISNFSQPRQEEANKRFYA